MPISTSTLQKMMLEGARLPKEEREKILAEHQKNLDVFNATAVARIVGYEKLNQYGVWNDCDEGEEGARTCYVVEGPNGEQRPTLGPIGIGIGLAEIFEEHPYPGDDNAIT